jgi:hypothetical protein
MFPYSSFSSNQSYARDHPLNSVKIIIINTIIPINPINPTINPNNLTINPTINPINPTINPNNLTINPTINPINTTINTTIN